MFKSKGSSDATISRPFHGRSSFLRLLQVDEELTRLPMEFLAKSGPNAKWEGATIIFTISKALIRLDFLDIRFISFHSLIIH